MAEGIRLACDSLRDRKSAGAEWGRVAPGSRRCEAALRTGAAQSLGRARALLGEPAAVAIATTKGALPDDPLLTPSASGRGRALELLAP